MDRVFTDDGASLRPEIPFEKYPKTPRLYESPIIVTEKIDGTNGTIYVADGRAYAGSRNRWLTPFDDNFGFAAWVAENERSLVALLGDGWHRGEWFGQGIQRGYGLTEKRFALFNVNRWGMTQNPGMVGNVPGLTVVPTLKYVMEFDPSVLQDEIFRFQEIGSLAVPGFGATEGVCIFHERSRQIFKIVWDK